MLLDFWILEYKNMLRNKQPFPILICEKEIREIMKNVCFSRQESTEKFPYFILVAHTVFHSKRWTFEKQKSNDICHKLGLTVISSSRKRRDKKSANFTVTVS